jgi:hypothetical protein
MKKKLLWAGVCLACLIGALALWHGDRETIAALTPQAAAERWETAEKPYAMASVFLEDSQAVPQTYISEMYLLVENALTDGGVPSDTDPWYYGASYQTEATLENDGATSKVELTAVSGDFFRIHPMELLNGWYFTEDDVMHDRIVLDRQSAWDLFYSDNVAGQFVTLDGYTYQVAAVVDTETGTYNALAAGDTRRAWVLADSPALADSGAGYTCLEMVLPEPVAGFAVSTLKTALGDMISDSTTITDNSGRFSLENRWKILKNLETRGISLTAVDYPYWESAAQLVENHLALRLVPEVLLLAVPLISLIILLLVLNHRRTWGLHSIKDAVENAIDRKHQRDYEKSGETAVSYLDQPTDEEE